jgi:serine protease Do
MVKELLPRLLKDGRIQRSAIGVSVSAVQPEDAKRLGLPNPSGALLRVVVPGGPADRAGLRPDDVVVGLEGQPVPGPDRLRWLASLAGVGRNVTLRVIRAGRTFDIQVRLEELSREPDRPRPEDFPGFP